MHAQFQGSEMFPGLFQDFMDGYIKPEGSSYQQMNTVQWLYLRVPNEDDPRLYLKGSQFSVSVLLNLCSEQWQHKILRLYLRTPTPAVLVHLQLEWNTYLLFNSNIVNFVWKTDEGEVRGRKHFLKIFVPWRSFNHRWVRGCGLGQKVLFRAS